MRHRGGYRPLAVPAQAARDGVTAHATVPAREQDHPLCTSSPTARDLLSPGPGFGPLLAVEARCSTRF